MKLLLNFVGIVAASIVAAVVYGILHDQVTARVCIEYFTVAHPPLIHCTDPTVLAFFWGTVATWWVGLPLGVGLAIACCCRKQKTPLKAVIAPLVRLISVLFVFAFVSGMSGYLAFRHGFIQLPDGYSDVIPASHHAGFVADWCSHLASYLFGFLGGCTLISRAARGKYAGNCLPDKT
jgi:hypothetical protein